MAKKKRKYTKRDPKFWGKKVESPDVGLMKNIPKKKTAVRAVSAKEKQAIKNLVDIQTQATATEEAEPMTFMDAVRELQAEDGVKIQAPKEYSDLVIGETMLSVFNSLRNQSQHDVVLATPQLIKDIVDQAYARGVMSVQNANSN